MDLNEVKKLINGRGERVILMEDGNPTMVLLSYEDYKKISNGDNSQTNLFDAPKGSVDESIDEGHGNAENDLTLEDLPF